MSDPEAGPSIARLAGQLGYLFDDEPSLRDASVEQLTARLNQADRLARAIAHYPNRTDAEIRTHLDEFADRISSEDVEQACRQALGHD